MPVLDGSLGLIALGGLLPIAALLWQLYRLRLQQAAERSAYEQLQLSAERQQASDAEQLHRLNQQCSALQTQNVAQTGKLAAQEREISLSQGQSLQAQQTIAALQGRLAEQEQELRQLDSALAMARTQLMEQQSHQQQRLDDLHAARESLRVQFAELASQIFDERELRFSQNSQAQLGQLLDPLKERIQAFEKRVEQSYQAEARERFSLAKELERLQQLNMRLGDQAQHLTQALRGQKTQGQWGEMVLERVLESAGLEKGREYQTQVSFYSAEGERFIPDVVIHLPGNRQIVVDAKVSLSAYQQALACEDEGQRESALRAHVCSLRNHLKGLATKQYHRLEGLKSLEFVLLFVPIEAAFAAALKAEPQLFDEAYQQQIIIVSPTTLLATLRLLDSLWRQERQTQNAREIAQRAGALYDKFVAFVADLDEIGLRLQQLDKAYAAARNKMLEGRGNLVGRAENLKLLGAQTSKSLPAHWLDKAELSLEQPPL